MARRLRRFDGNKSARWKRFQRNYRRAAKITNFAPQKLEGLDKWARSVAEWEKHFVGIEALLHRRVFPANGRRAGHAETRYWKSWRTCMRMVKTRRSGAPSGHGDSAQPLPCVLYFGPKTYDD